MPRHATDGRFDYARAHQAYTTRTLTAPSWSRRGPVRLSGTRDGAVRLPGTATTLRPLSHDDDGDPRAYVIRYRDTDIVTLYHDGRVRLDNGGWPTVTTVRKMQEYTPEHVSVSGRDIIAKRWDANPRIEVTSPDGLAVLDFEHTVTFVTAIPVDPPSGRVETMAHGVPVTATATVSATVLALLSSEPRDFGRLAAMAGRQGVSGSTLHDTLCELLDSGKAAITYGQGWHLTTNTEV